MPPVSSQPPNNPIDGKPNTLGAVLYADAGAPAPESEWTELVRSMAEGNQNALRELYERTHRIVFTLIFRIVKDPLTAEEVLLDVYHDVWRTSATFDPARGTVVAWLMNMTRSRAIDRLRGEQTQKRTPPREWSDAVETRGDPSAAEQTQRVLERSLQALSPDERLAIETAYYREMTYVEVAECLGHPVGTIKTRIRTGLAKLRTLLAAKKDDL